MDDKTLEKMVARHLPEPKTAGHTPGPWVMVGKDIQQAGSNDPSYVARVGCSRDWSQEDAMNGMLIAAAPELLAALEELVCNFVNEAPHCSEGYTFKARAAIAKAKGAKA